MDKRYWIQCGETWINPDNVAAIKPSSGGYTVYFNGSRDHYTILSKKEAEPLLAFMHYFHFTG